MATLSLTPMGALWQFFFYGTVGGVANGVIKT
jgi:hypothetical protein